MNHHSNRFPGENDDYRHARNELLQLEIELRRQIETIASKRRSLPLGGKIQQDYVFDEGASDLSDQNIVHQTRLSELFEPGKNSLIIYSFMYAGDNKPCPMCTALLDGLNGNTPHVQQRTNFVVVAKAPIQKIRSWAWERDWHKLRLLSSANNSFNLDYFAETADGDQLPDINVFRKTPEGIYHHYNSELLFTETEAGQEPRHADMIWPLWNLLDLVPEGRGIDWYPNYSYD